MKILELFQNLQFEIEVENINNVDSVLETKENEVSIVMQLSLISV